MSDEIKEEKLDSPLVVHKKSDASYQETASEVSMSATHTDEEADDIPTLERHRFKKIKKRNRFPLFLLFAAVIVGVICALVYSGVIPIGEKETTTTTQKSYTTSPVNEFEGIITVKGTYIFFEGEELGGIKDLERQVKYLNAGTKFVVQDEKADSDFLNFEVLSILSKYNIDYDITHIVSSGLISQYETTAPKSTAPASSSTAAPSTSTSAPSTSAQNNTEN